MLIRYHKWREWVELFFVTQDLSNVLQVLNSCWPSWAVRFCVWNWCYIFQKYRNSQFVHLRLLGQFYLLQSCWNKWASERGHVPCKCFYILREAHQMAEINPTVLQYTYSTHCRADPDSLEKHHRPKHRPIPLIHVCCLSHLGTTLQGKLAGASTRTPVVATDFPSAIKYLISQFFFLKKNAWKIYLKVANLTSVRIQNWHFIKSTQLSRVGYQ